MLIPLVVGIALASDSSPGLVLPGAAPSTPGATVSALAAVSGGGPASNKTVFGLDATLSAGRGNVEVLLPLLDGNATAPVISGSYRLVSTEHLNFAPFIAVGGLAPFEAGEVAFMGTAGIACGWASMRSRPTSIGGTTKNHDTPLSTSAWWPMSGRRWASRRASSSEARSGGGPSDGRGALSGPDGRRVRGALHVGS